MNSEPKSTLSNNNLRRMQGWAKAVYPKEWQDRCAVVAEYIAQLTEEDATAILKKPWPDVFAQAERDWPEAFAGWRQETVEQN